MLLGLVTSVHKTLQFIDCSGTCVCYGHLGTSQECPDYQGVQVSLHDNVSFGTITRRVGYAGVHIFKCPD